MMQVLRISATVAQRCFLKMEYQRGLASIATKETAASTPFGVAPSGRVGFKLEGWVQGQLTRAIGQALLDAERNTMDKKKLMELLQNAGAVKSQSHFRESVRMLEKMKRVEVNCLGPVRIGSREQTFRIYLTSRGKRVYSWHRHRPSVETSQSDTHI